MNKPSNNENNEIPIENGARQGCSVLTCSLPTSVEISRRFAQVADLSARTTLLI